MKTQYRQKKKTIKNVCLKKESEGEEREGGERLRQEEKRRRGHVVQSENWKLPGQPVDNVWGV